VVERKEEEVGDQAQPCWERAGRILVHQAGSCPWGAADASWVPVGRSTLPGVAVTAPAWPWHRAQPASPGLLPAVGWFMHTLWHGRSQPLSFADVGSPPAKHPCFAGSEPTAAATGCPHSQLRPGTDRTQGTAGPGGKRNSI